MAATGGGKIRSRRYHIASKPYAKSKQPQSGLISRVTDTVKSIVPSWLQKYFKNGDVSEDGGAVLGTEQNCLRPQPSPNGSEEGPPPLDGRDSPEPSTSNAEPTTSRASLNFHECVLSRPPLSRSHLAFPPLDVSSPNLGMASSLLSQPSTSTAPGPFSTGFSLVKEIKDNLSQHEDDNISTTSGFSSRASDKDVPTSKTASLPQLWSPETDRTHSGPQPSQSSLKKPAFNLSVFGTSSNSTFNNTVLNSSQLGDSPFYPGKTMYGGAAAVRSVRSRPGTPYQAPVRRQIKAKPAGVQPCGVTSATARRILQSLERMSSPLADARRIPAAGSSPLSASMNDSNLDVSHPQAKKKRVDSSVPPVQRLMVPTATPVSGSRSVSFRPTLTPGGMSRPVEKTPIETPTRQSQQLPETILAPSQSTSQASGPAYPLSSTPAASSVTSGGGKMRREKTTTRVSSKRLEEDEVAEVPDLPRISLPSSTLPLPTFDFTSPLPPLGTTSSKVTPVTPAAKDMLAKKPLKASTPPSVPFTFSSPIVKATASSPASFSPSAGFTFSAPVAKLGPSMSNGKLATPIAAALKPTASKSTEEFDGPFKPAKTLKQGSVLDLLKAPGFASPVAQTSASSDDTPHKTTAPSFSFSSSSSSSTSTSTTSTTTASSTGFSGLFKAPPGWNCDVCLVHNKPSDKKCVCCMANKPASPPAKPLDSKPAAAASPGLESSSSISSSSSSSSSASSTSTTTTTTMGFGAMFAKPAGTWDCDTCLVSNKPEAVKCVACDTAKPGTGLKPSLTIPPSLSAPAAPVGFGDKFKKPEGSWDCDTCLVQNKAEDSKCVACMSAKPGASAGTPSSASSAPLLGFGDAFKRPSGSWDCDVCLVQNKAADVACVACQTAKPGAKAEPKAAGTSSAFGSSSSTSGGFKFGTSGTTAASASVSGGFKFGTSQTTSGSDSVSGGFKFGTSEVSLDLCSGSGVFESECLSSESTSKDAAPSAGFKFGGSSGGFKFGSAASDEKKSEQPAATSGFKFGAGGSVALGATSSSADSPASKVGFTFGQSKPEDKLLSAASSSPSAVSLTPPASSQEKSDGNPNTTTTTSSSSSSSVSVFKRLGEPSLTTSTPQGGATFGSSLAAAPTFAFGKPEEKKDAPTLFGSAARAGAGAAAAAAAAAAAPPPSSLGGFVFDKPSAPVAPPSSVFGKTTEKSDTPAAAAAAAEAPKPSFTFGQSATDSPAAPKPTFSFGVSNPAAASSAPPSSGPAPSLFGAAAVTSGDAPPAKAPFIFGQSQASQPAAAPAPAQAQPFIFGGAPSAAPPSAAPSFSFGAAAPSAASTTAASTASSPFTFSAAPSGGFGASQTPSFSSSFSSPFTAAPSPAPAFGAGTVAASVFGQQTYTPPVFDAASNAAPGGFQFGGASAFGSTNSNSGVFTFGAGAAAPPAAPANPSIAPPQVVPGSGFNFAQPPAFNMGSSQTFAGTTAGQQVIAGRRIKAAVRRRK
ncbi:nuclear pore complex protein Nup153 isoform X2 [Nelusetta ayraudi]|uniref:nuclear pore complex protein Nup153 isoform X2 n=1 Tax=Nelusetta ayraudi TaxID=303726 RepID=UPI003F720F27